jgi:hypothetical protein
MKSSTNGTKKTLDIQHNLRLQDFQERQAKLDDLRNELTEIERRLHDLDEVRRNDHEFTDDNLNEYLRLQDERQSLEKSIISLERSCDEVDYYVNTASLLFRYYDIVEKGVEDLSSNPKVIKEKSILKYFFTNPDPNEPDPEQQKQMRLSDRATLLDKYMSYTDPNYLKSIETECKDQCINCGSANRSVLLNDGLIFCNDCATVEYIIVDHERPSYRDPPKEISYFKAEYKSRLKVLYLLVLWFVKI